MKYKRRVKYYLLKVFRLHDSARSIAGGFAWGVFVHFYPTMGFGALVAVALARLFRTNLVAATVGWAITTPLFPFFFYLNYLVGQMFLGPKEERIISALGHRHVEMKEIFVLGKAYFIGAGINSAVLVAVLWWVGVIILIKYRKQTIKWIKKTI